MLSANWLVSVRAKLYLPAANRRFIASNFFRTCPIEGGTTGVGFTRGVDVFSGGGLGSAGGFCGLLGGAAAFRRACTVAVFPVVLAVLVNRL